MQLLGFHELLCVLFQENTSCNPPPPTVRGGHLAADSLQRRGVVDVVLVSLQHRYDDASTHHRQVVTMSKRSHRRRVIVHVNVIVTTMALCNDDTS